MSDQFKNFVDRLKQAVRVAEALASPLQRQLPIDGRPVSLVRSRWWDDTNEKLFEREIEPYFTCLRGTPPPRAVLDIGAAVGLFSLAACVRFPQARIYAFEPSRRQRILLRRNIARNGFQERVRVEARGVWNCEASLSFRTNGAISALQASGSHLAGLPFVERVPVMRLDTWSEEVRLTGLDLIKMDIEGAELEALAGGTRLLRESRPRLLIQAYHLRGGVRTFERCVELVKPLGYRCREAIPEQGLLDAIPDR